MDVRKVMLIMAISAETVQKIQEILEPVFHRIGAGNIRKQVDLAIKFARSQLPVEMILDGKKAVGIAVDIATVYSPEGNYYRYVDENHVVQTAESVQALSIVLIDQNVILCKSSYDVISNPSYENPKFINALYRTTTPDALTETYIC